MSFFSKFPKFLVKYSDELRTVGSSLGLLLRFIPVSPVDRAKLNVAFEALTTAADSIAGSIEDVQKMAKAAENAKTVKVSKSDIKAAVQELAPDLLGGLIEAGIRKALAEMDKDKADAPA